MTTPFLEYELLSPETADPVVIRITGQKARGFPDFRASNGVWITSWTTPEYYPSGKPSPVLVVWGSEENGQEAFAIRIPLSDWPAVKQAIRELNEYYGEKEMNLKSEGERILNILKSSIEPTGDTYRDVVRLIENSLAENERLLNLYQQAVKGRQDFRKIVLTRKKPKVDDRENTPVKEDRYYALYGSWEQFSNFWDAVHYYANNSESRRSPVIASTPQYVRVKEEDYVVFATIVQASGLKHQKSPGPYVEAL